MVLLRIGTAMADKTAIEWTDATWNPVTGCTQISPGCKNCYAERLAARLRAMGNPRYRNGFELTLHRDQIDRISRRGRRPKRRRKLQLYVLQGLPGIGPEKAGRLLERFGSVEGVMAASEQDLQLVPGIGERIARSIRWLLEADQPGSVGG